MNILAVDDEPRGINMLSRSIRTALPEASISSFQHPCDALEHAGQNPIDVAFLDVHMPEMDGLELAIELKKLYPKINIIFVTGYSEHAEDAFALHASGYVHKPVSPGAVREQMENLRFTPEQRALTQELGPYTLDHGKQRVYYKGQDSLLTQKEYQLLSLFAENIGVSLPPESLFQRIWGSDPYGGIDTVKVHVSNLRRKLEMGRGRNPNIVKRRAGGFYLELNDKIKP